MSTFYTDSCLLVHLNGGDRISARRETDSNAIVLSDIDQLHAEISVDTLAFKYVQTGEEQYDFGSRRIKLQPRTFLLANPNEPKMEVRIKTKHTKGVCVNIKKELFAQASAAVMHVNDFENPDGIDLWSDKHWVSMCLSDVGLEQHLSLLNNGKLEDPIGWLYDLVPKILYNQRAELQGLYKIQAEKESTKKALFDKMQLSKQLLRDSIYHNVKMCDIAAAIGLSDFRFYRVFKMTYGNSPLQYLLACRMQASLALKAQGYSWTEIAYRLNFTDVAAFSNLFKKQYGVAPSRYK